LAAERFATQFRVIPPCALQKRSLDGVGAWTPRFPRDLRALSRACEAKGGSAVLADQTSGQVTEDRADGGRAMMHWLFLYAPLLLLAVSLLALWVSWRPHRKPRLKVEFGNKTLVWPAENDRPFTHSPPFLHLLVTNHGPGEIVIVSAIAKLASFPQSLFTEARYQPLLPDFKHPYCFKLPTPRLAVGGQASIIFRYNKDCFLTNKPKRVGVVDSFKRTHWASRRELKKTLREYRESFPAQPAEAAR